MKKVVSLILVLMLVLSALCGAMADALSDIQAKGKLVVGASVGFPPYEFYFTNPETNQEEYAGFDMELAKGVAAYLGVELEIADQSFAGLITALRAGEIDMIISGMAIKPERKEQIDFSIPYYTGTQIMLVKAEDYDTLTTVADMKGKAVGAQMGTLQAGILEEQFADSEPMEIDQVALLVLNLLQGQLDGVLLTDLVAKTYISLNPGKLAISQIPVEYDNAAGVGIGVAKGDNETLLAAVNEYLTMVLSDGTFDSWIDDATAKNGMLLNN